MSYFLSTLVLALVYLALTQSLQPSNVVVSVLIGFAVSLMVKPQGKPNLAKLPVAFATMLVYIVRLLIDIVKSGITVASYILNPKLPIQPGVVAIKSNSPNPLVTAISAHGITITPGEMVIEIGEDGSMFTHCLNAPATAAGGDAGQTARKALLDKIFI